MDPNQQQPEQLQQNINYNGMQEQSQHQQQQPTNNSKSVRKKPYVKITEQPASKALRFRYECEGRSAGSIPGANSTSETKTYPTIEIVGYKGRAVVVVSCVTKDKPYRPHPHNLVGKEGCKKGVCTLEINSETMKAVFSNLGIQCVKKKDIEAALKAREEIRVDPFKTGFAHRFQPSSIDLNSVRLCFQVFMEGEQKGRFTQPLPPVVSEPIYDKKAMSDLVICRLCSCSATVLGNTQIILLCEKVAKEDISVRFYEENNGQTIWEAFGEFQHTDVHKQTAIAFKTPRYRKVDITEPAKVFIQLKRPSDGITSEALPFEYVPLDSGRKRFLDLRRNLKRKPDLDIFQEILSIEEKGQLCNDESEVIDLNKPIVEDLPTPQSLQSQNETVLTSTDDRTNSCDEEAKRRSQEEIDLIIDEKMRELEQQQHQKADQEVAELLNVAHQDQENRMLLMDANEKITEWMNSNEFLEMKNLTVNESMETNSSTTTANTQVAANELEDKTLNDLLEQVAELDGIYSDQAIHRDNYNSSLINELNVIDSCVPTRDSTLVNGGQTAMEVEESFDDAATYSSLQIAFKNPISIPMQDIMPLTPSASNLEVDFENDHYDPIEVRPSPSSVASISPAPEVIAHKPDILAQTQPQLQAPPRPAPPQSNSPHMHVTAAEEEKLPPLPPKRLRKQDSNAENRSIEANIGDTLDRKSRQQTPIIIMKTPDQSPPTKRLPQKPGSSSTLPRQKKPGFFSKLFSRRKSKSDLSPAEGQSARSVTGSKAATPTASREPSISHFNSNSSNRASMRSTKSLQPSSLPSSPDKRVKKIGKPVGRSVSSVSDPAHLRRKRQKTNGDPVHLLLEQQKNQHQDGRQTNMNYWNTTNIPAIKTEPRDSSPQPHGMYRVPPELTPSPQPLSPSSAYTHNTPSPYSMSTAGAQGNQQLISPNQQYNVTNAVGGGNAAPPMDIRHYNAFGQQTQQQLPYHSNNFGSARATEWETKFNPAAATGNNNINNLNNTNTFTLQNLSGASGTGWNITSNHYHPHQHHQHQQYQQPPSQNNGANANPAVAASDNNNGTHTNNTEHGLSNLLTFDSEQLVRINSEDQQMLQLNSEDLQISNLSIST